MDQGHGLSIEAVEQIIDLWTTPQSFTQKYLAIINRAADRRPICDILGKQIV